MDGCSVTEGEVNACYMSIFKCKGINIRVGWSIASTSGSLGIIPLFSSALRHLGINSSWNNWLCGAHP